MPRDDAAVATLHSLVQGIAAPNVKDQRTALTELRLFLEALNARTSMSPHKLLGIDVCCNLAVLTLDRFVKPCLAAPTKTKAALSSLRKDVTTIFRGIVEVLHSFVAYDDPLPPLSWKDAKVVPYILQHVTDTLRSDTLVRYVAADYCQIVQCVLAHQVYVGCLSAATLEETFTTLLSTLNVVGPEDTAVVSETIARACQNVFASRVLPPAAMLSIVPQICTAVLQFHNNTTERGNNNARVLTALVSAADATLRLCSEDFTFVRTSLARLGPVLAREWHSIRKDAWRLAAGKFFTLLLERLMSNRDKDNDNGANEELLATLSNGIFLGIINHVFESNTALLTTVSIKQVASPDCTILEDVESAAVLSMEATTTRQREREDDDYNTAQKRAKRGDPVDIIVGHLRRWLDRPPNDETFYLAIRVVIRLARTTSTSSSSIMSPEKINALVEVLLLHLGYRSRDSAVAGHEVRLVQTALAALLEVTNTNNTVITAMNFSSVLNHVMSNVNKYFMPENTVACSLASAALTTATSGTMMTLSTSPIPWSHILPRAPHSGKAPWLKLLTASVRYSFASSAANQTSPLLQLSDLHLVIQCIPKILQLNDDVDVAAVCELSRVCTQVSPYPSSGLVSVMLSAIENMECTSMECALRVLEVVLTLASTSVLPLPRSSGDFKSTTNLIAQQTYRVLHGVISSVALRLSPAAPSPAMPSPVPTLLSPTSSSSPNFLTTLVSVLTAYKSAWSHVAVLVLDPQFHLVKALAALTRALTSIWAASDGDSSSSASFSLEGHIEKAKRRRPALEATAILCSVICTPIVRSRCTEPLVNIRTVVTSALEHLQGSPADLSTGMPSFEAIACIVSCVQCVMLTEDPSIHTALLSVLTDMFEKHRQGLLVVFLQCCTQIARAQNTTVESLSRLSATCLSIIEQDKIPTYCGARTAMCDFMLAAAKRLSRTEMGMTLGKHIPMFLTDTTSRTVRRHALDILPELIMAFDNSERAFVDIAEAISSLVLPPSSSSSTTSSEIAPPIRASGLESSLCRDGIDALVNIIHNKCMGKEVQEIQDNISSGYTGVQHRALLVAVKYASATHIPERNYLLSKLVPLKANFLECISFLTHEWIAEYDIVRFPFHLLGMDNIHAALKNGDDYAGSVLFSGLVHRAARRPHGADALRSVGESFGFHTDDIKLYKQVFHVVVGLAGLMRSSTDKLAADLGNQVLEGLEVLFGETLFRSTLRDHLDGIVCVMLNNTVAEMRTYRHPFAPPDALTAALRWLASTVYATTTTTTTTKSSLDAADAMLFTADRCVSWLVHLHRRVCSASSQAHDRVAALDAFVRCLSPKPSCHGSVLVVRLTCRVLVSVLETIKMTENIERTVLRCLDEVLKTFVEKRPDVVGEVLPHVLAMLVAAAVPRDVSNNNHDADMQQQQSQHLPKAPDDLVFFEDVAASLRVDDDNDDDHGNGADEDTTTITLGTIVSRLVSCPGLKASVSDLDSLCFEPQLRRARNAMIRQESFRSQKQRLSKIILGAVARFKKNSSSPLLTTAFVRFSELARNNTDAVQDLTQSPEELFKCVRALIPYCGCNATTGVDRSVQCAAVEVLRQLWSTAPVATISVLQRRMNYSDLDPKMQDRDVSTMLSVLRGVVVSTAANVTLFDRDPVAMHKALRFLRVGLHFHWTELLAQCDDSDVAGNVSALRGDKSDASNRTALRSDLMTDIDADGLLHLNVLSDETTMSSTPPEAWIRRLACTLVAITLEDADPLRCVAELCSVCDAIARAVVGYCLLTLLTRKRSEKLRKQIAKPLTACLSNPAASNDIRVLLVNCFLQIHAASVHAVSKTGFRTSSRSSSSEAISNFPIIPTNVSEMLAYPVPALSLAYAAEQCGMYRAALLFTEIECDRERFGVVYARGATITTSATATAIPSVIHERLLNIFRNLNDPDFLFSLSLGGTAEGRLAMLRHRGEHNRVATIHEAMGNRAALASTLQMLGLSTASWGLLSDAKQFVLGDGGTTDWSELRAEAAWRQGEWALMSGSTSPSSSTAPITSLPSFHANLCAALNALAEHREDTFTVSIRGAHSAVLRAFDVTKNVASHLVKLQCIRLVEACWAATFMASSQTRVDVIPFTPPARIPYPEREPLDAVFPHLLHIAQRDELLTPHLLVVAQLAKKAKCHDVALRALHHPSLLSSGGGALPPVGEVLLAKTLWKLEEHDLAFDVLTAAGSTSSNSDAAASARRQQLIGKWKAESKLDSISNVVQQHLQPAAVTLNTGKAHYLVARYYDDVHLELSNQVHSGQHRTFVEQVEEMGKNKDALKNEFRRAYSGMDEGKKRQLKRRLNHQDREHELLSSELQRFESDMKTSCMQALQSYALALQLGGLSPAKTTTAVYRFTAIWLANSDDDDVTSVVQSSLPNLRPTLFLSLFTQLCSRIGTAPASSEYQTTLKRLITSIVRVHPYGTLYNLFALANGYRYPAAEADVQEVDTEKVNQSKAIIQDLVRSQPELRKTVTELESLIEAYIELAFWTPPAKTKKHTLTPSLAAISGFSHCPSPTCETGPAGVVDPIRGFDSLVELVGGLNVPKLVRCTTASGEVHKQLVKSRDDLRQDALVEQVFRLCNDLFTSHTATRDRALSIRTYLVIPLTPTSGIVQWVENSTTLSEYLTGTFEAPELGAHARYHPNDMSNYDARVKLQNVSQHPAKVKTATFLDICNKFTPSMHHFFTEMFPTVELWLSRRVAYTGSVAAGSMVGHIVGLGDRHTSNVLIDCKTGEIIHIDIGLAFDEGMLLPVPELIPFRLTRDMVDGFGVTGVEGGFRRSCEATLAVLRDSKDMLHTVLDALLHDPLAKWAVDVTKALGAASSSVKKKKKSGQAHADALRASAKVRDKLSGVLEHESLTVSAQVQKLIQQATSNDTLAALFPGWAPWV